MAQVVHLTPRAQLPDFRKFKLGKRTPSQEVSGPRLSLKTDGAPNTQTIQLAPGIPKPPVSVDWYTGNPDHSELGNYSVGDCVTADMGHMANQLLWQNGVPALVTDADALAAYANITGYVPGNPATDTGSLLTDGLNYMLIHGMQGVKIGAWAIIEWNFPAQMQYCISDFFGVHGGLQLPQSAYTQINAGQPWTVVKGSPIVGGHATYFVGYDQNYYYINTWGFIQRVSYDFVNYYYDEAYVSASPKTATAAVMHKYNTAQLDYNWGFCTGSPMEPFERPVLPA